jgi:hypothetical protein
MEMRTMKRLITSLVLSTVALGHTMAAAAQPAALERTASSVSETEGMGGGSGIWAVVAAVVVGLGIIILIEESENDSDDFPVSP